ncbi:kh domain-containing protein at4g18375 [Phtheirospermum japonicum]|uniref:Kh domain-containing protein at4g18375 n=1 Tax=Phtheirospermum japonicum TaxID=374723 RepID=A0A830BDV7_9LAMI|nr:kh domain-containing protein at4g18375 [Phtheirospermum japonicum]
MERDRRHFLSNYSSPHFKRRGGPRKGKQSSTANEEASGNFHSSDTVYRILCHSDKIGSVIGKGGSIVKALRDETQARITVSDSVPGSDERVITILSPFDQKARRHRRNNDAMEPHCAAQDALLKVHNRIVEEDLRCTEKGYDDETMVSARLLVPDVGCLLGRKGDVIQRLRCKTGANIRVLPSDHVAACAMSGDELVQISGKLATVKEALYEISTLLHRNLHRDKPPPSFPLPYASHPPHFNEGFRHPGPPMRNMLPPENSTWLERDSDAHRMQPMPFRAGYEISPPAFRADHFDGDTPPHDQETATEFTIKILCSADRIGSVIGKGGCNVRQLEQETGASIYVDDASKQSNERVIRVSSFECPSDRRSRTIDAILHLQNKTSEFSEEGTITTKLIVAANKVGCLLGQGGHVINDMRRRTHADIRVFSKEGEKPRCALADEELVQFYADPQGGVREYEPPSFQAPPLATGYLDVDEAKFSSVPATAGHHIAEFAGPRMNHHDRYPTGSDFNSPRNMYPTSGSLAALQDYPQRGAYQGYNSPHGAYPNYSVSPAVPYESSNRWPDAYQDKYAQEGSYQNVRAQHGSYQY